MAPNVMWLLTKQLWHLLTLTIITALLVTASDPHSSDSWDELVERPVYGCALTPDFDFAMLVLQWPAGQKKIHPSKVIDHFTIHGLWPSNDGKDYSNYPCQCTDEVFNSNTLPQTLIAGLNEYFPTNFAGQSFGFWAHEWKKHGTCAGSIPGCGTVQGYFEKSLQLRKAVSVESGLENGGLMPNDRTAYTQRSILDALKNHTGVAPLLGCTSFNGYRALSQVSFCFDTKLELIECDYAVRNNRGGGVTNCDDSPSSPVYIPSRSWANW